MIQKRSGMCLQSPLQFYCATKMSAFTGKLDKIQVFFDFDFDEDDDDDMGQRNIKTQMYRESINRYTREYNNYIKQMEDELNQWLGPNLQYVHDDKVKHKDLLELNDL